MSDTNEPTEDREHGFHPVPPWARRRDALPGAVRRREGPPQVSWHIRDREGGRQGLAARRGPDGRRPDGQPLTRSAEVPHLCRRRVAASPSDGGPNARELHLLSGPPYPAVVRLH